jgi:hypothetical protein
MYVIAVKCDATWQLQTRAWESMEGVAAEVARLRDCGCETKVVKLEVEDPIRVATSAPQG